MVPEKNCGHIENINNVCGRDEHYKLGEKDCLEYFLDDFLKVQFITELNRMKLTDILGSNKAQTIEEINSYLKIDEFGLKTFLEILSSFDVIEIKDGRYCLTDSFQKATSDREYFKARLNYSRLVFSDISNNLGKMITTGNLLSEGIMGSFWKYPDNVASSDEKKIKNTERWVKFMSALTKQDSDSCIDNYDFSQHKNILELGGNSGEFAIHICKRYKDTHIEIIDLPDVAKIGEENVRKKGYAQNISFMPGDFFTGRFPEKKDLIMLKSVLVDWEFGKVKTLLEKCYESLDFGGKILICEHEKIDLKKKGELDKNIIFWNFLKYFKDKKFYESLLSEIGFREINSCSICKNGFMIISARK